MPVNTDIYTQLAFFLNSVCFWTVTDHEIIIPRKLKVLSHATETKTQHNKRNKRGRRIFWDLSPGGGGRETPIWKGRGYSTEILNLIPKRDQSGHARSLCRPLKETSLRWLDRNKWRAICLSKNSNNFTISGSISLKLSHFIRNLSWNNMYVNMLI